ncbi:MAG: hypothetical protein AVDCRST_MAG89-1219 [uncultured Gemmatimonadetes bacterium]|uniref:Uncharacterized protein n=1 Tax=uncultured Gemmatimonadota bacterium TaxID=203437 RepID=A0A6J4KT20_9BACT|nr:MAG: hypothetical protein AVDCRST_MAG89-1219 [uncultured Gemmatimonadota bacterium]
MKTRSSGSVSAPGSVAGREGENSAEYRRKRLASSRFRTLGP